MEIKKLSDEGPIYTVGSRLDFLSISVDQTYISKSNCN